MSSLSLPPTTIGRRVDRALYRLLDLDSSLLEEDAHERSVAHKLAVYLGDEFPRFDVDFEYNREGIERTVKRLDLEDDDKSVFPDVIVHERGSDTRNCLVIELKLDSSTRPRTDDYDKLKAFTGAEERFQYDFGLFIEILTGNDVRLFRTKWYENGECIGPHLRGYPRTWEEE